MRIQFCNSIYTGNLHWFFTVNSAALQRCLMVVYINRPAPLHIDFLAGKTHSEWSCFPSFTAFSQYILVPLLLDSGEYRRNYGESREKTGNDRNICAEATDATALIYPYLFAKATGLCLVAGPFYEMVGCLCPWPVLIQFEHGTYHTLAQNCLIKLWCGIMRRAWQGKHSHKTWSKENWNWELTLPFHVPNKCQISCRSYHRHSQWSGTTVLSCAIHED